MLAYILALFCAIPAVLSIFFIKKIEKDIYPILYSLYASVLIEVFEIFAISTNTKVLQDSIYNLFIIINITCFLVTFHKLKLIKNKSIIVVICTGLIFHFLEFYVYGSYRFLSNTYIFEGIVIVWGCTLAIMQKILTTYNNLFKFYLIFFLSIITDHLFIILNTILIWLVPLSIRTENLLFNIFSFANAFSYLLMAYSFLCLVPKKK